MPKYHFSLGDSNEGAVGMCGIVRAKSKEEAVEILREALPTQVDIPICEEEHRIEYFNLYINPKSIHVSDIDDEEDDPEETEERNRENTPEDEKEGEE